VALFIVAVLGGVAAALALTRGGTENALAQGRPGVIARGPFRSLGWGTTGTAQIVRDGSGHLKVRLSSNFSTQQAPELFVYLARYKGQRRTQWTEVSSLRSASGKQEYDLPADAVKSLHVSVAIYCGKCNRVFGAAKLQPMAPPA
jgi:hypothetical protein